MWLVGNEKPRTMAEFLVVWPVSLETKADFDANANGRVIREL